MTAQELGEADHFGNNMTRMCESVKSIRSFLHSYNTSLCTTTKVLTGENDKEPDVHVCLDGLDRECVAYSIGIADNWIFDDLMLERGCVVRSFDPTMVKFPPEHYARSDRHKFEAIGVGAESRVETRGGDTTRNYGGKAVYAVETLDDMMTRHGHARLSVLRMDVEGAEWHVLEQMLASGVLDRVDQLLLEIHLHRPLAKMSAFVRTLHRIRDDHGLQLFWTERNRWDAAWNDGSCFLSKSRLEFTKNRSCRSW